MDSGTKSWFLQRSYRGSHMQEGKYDVKQHAWSLCHFAFVRRNYLRHYIYIKSEANLSDLYLLLCRLVVAWRSAAQTMTRISRQREKLFQCLVFRQKMIPKETERNGTRVFQMYLRTQWVKRHAFVTGLKRSRSTRTTGRREKLFNIVEYISLFFVTFLVQISYFTISL